MKNCTHRYKHIKFAMAQCNFFKRILKKIKNTTPMLIFKNIPNFLKIYKINFLY
jgi:hypothetical protein